MVSSLRILPFRHWLVALAAPVGTLFAADGEGIAFFEKKIRPLLAERCYECHAEGKKIKAGLRLDTPEGWMEGGDSGPAIVPGKVDSSLIIRAVRYLDQEVEAMPPKSALPAEEVALLEEWVRRGAPAPSAEVVAGAKKSGGIDIAAGKKFWAFIPPTTPPPPTLAKHATWPRSDIDRFIAAKWETHNLSPTPDADRLSLVRRVYYDLIGLPPTPEEADAFVRDTRPDAFARVVDTLLASPHFGERWGRHWLDVARFAESSGGGRTLLFKDAWRYRDYVIETFNRDVPFSTFIREQIAGDLLPHSTPDERARQLSGTAFLALGPTNYEEQNKGALRMDIVDEQLDAIGKGFLGMTIGCARCHDHKFDPIPTADYYALAGILRSTRTLHNYTDNVARWVDTILPMEQVAETKYHAQQARISELEVKLKELRKATVAASATASTGTPIALKDVPGIVIDETKAKIVGQWHTNTFGKNYVGAGYLDDRNTGKGEKTITFTPTFPRSGRYDVRLAYTAASNRAGRVPVLILHADGEHTLTIDQRKPPPGGDRFISLGQYRFEQNGQGYVLISNEETEGYVNVDALQLLPLDDAKTETSGRGAVAGETGADRELRERAKRDLEKLEAELKKLVATSLRPAQTMSVAEAEDIGDTEIRIRGNVKALGAKVPRGFLQVAMHAEAPQFSAKESGRRELAEWIASPTNSLTARVTVNRAWAWLIGAGLVRTVDNFGATGETPSHPELLDHLALQFVASGWSTKALVRSIVLSRTYHLATAAPNAGDPDNRWLARAHRRRLDAEQIRDTMLWVSGALDLAIAGPNIGKGPTGAANLPVNAEYTYVFTDTRRSVYTPAFRNQRLELFEAFDFADINAPVGQRNVSTVAPQALYLMNHSFVREQAQRASERELTIVDRKDEARVQQAYRLALGRNPTSRELALAMDYLKPEAGTAPANASERNAPWSHLYQALFACVDFRYLN